MAAAKSSKATRVSRRVPVTAPAWDLTLYVTGQTAKSIAALANLKRICDTRLSGRHHITVIDLAANPRLAKLDQILAVPTVVVKSPTSLKRIIGDLSDEKRVLVGLGLETASATCAGA